MSTVKWQQLSQSKIGLWTVVGMAVLDPVPRRLNTVPLNSVPIL